ncbi:hypothetical protein Cgig2_032387 [Carnegiea gigantea]|uniref:Ubiquitin-like protease family profile domain-containing protein n=1 Tax=Carnegiea gigantea TaxID=171969 RepID=A0A9Q1GPY5_9CARY|nr:hypothetical protein Cgig2_032387 [Carnegiea gigantea]
MAMRMQRMSFPKRLVMLGSITLRLTCALTLTDREEDMPKCLPKLVPVSWLRGLIHVVPKGGAGDRSGKYCVRNLVMDLFTELLHRRQRTYPTCLLLVADLRDRSFLPYNLLPAPAAKTRQELLDSVRIALVLAFLRSTTYADAGQWEVVTPKCPEQRNGHDCGVFVMAFMDLLSLKADGFEFDQDCVVHYEENGLVILIPTHRHHCNRIDNKSCIHTPHGDIYMELSISIAEGNTSYPPIDTIV